MRASSALIVALLCTSTLACGAKKQDPAQAEAATNKVQPEAVKPKAIETAPIVTEVDCMGVLGTLKTKDAKASLQFTAKGAIVPLTFEPEAIYKSNPVWDAGDAPSMCASVMQPPAVEVPMLTLIGQFKVGKRPGLRLQAIGIVMGERDLGSQGQGMVTGYYLAADSDTPQALNFTSGKLVLERDASASSAIKLTFSGTGGTLVGQGKAFTLDGSITATVGAR